MDEQELVRANADGDVLLNQVKARLATAGNRKLRPMIVKGTHFVLAMESPERPGRWVPAWLSAGEALFFAHAREDLLFLETLVESEKNMRKMLEEVCGAVREERNRLRERFTVPIVCMCGSTRYFRAFDDWNYRLTLRGFIVLNIGCNTKSDQGLKLTSEDKVQLDALHKQKIDLCDWVWVLDVDGYIGDSTRSEIEYAKGLGKSVLYLTQEYPDYSEPIDDSAKEIADLRAELALRDAHRLEHPHGHCDECMRTCSNTEVDVLKKELAAARAALAEKDCIIEGHEGSICDLVLESAGKGERIAELEGREGDARKGAKAAKEEGEV